MLAAIMLAESGKAPSVHDLFGVDVSWRGVGAGVLLGLVSYSLHLTVLEDWIMCFVLWCMGEHKNYKFPDLTHARWERSSSKGKAAVAQAGLDETYLWLFFLYCSGYLLLAGGVLLRCRGQLNGVWLLVAGLVFLLAALYGDFKATRHEIWLIRHWPPTPPAGQTPNQALHLAPAAKQVSGSP